MAFQFGNTTRLHHIDFPSTSTERGAPTACEQALQNSAADIQSEAKPTANRDHQKKGKINVRIRRKQEKETTRKTRPDRNAQSLSSTQIKREKLNNGDSCGLTQDGLPNRFNDVTQQATMCYMNLTVEWDVLDSFSEFATFLEVQNPICPAHLIDTPEKLFSVLSCEL